MASSGRKVHGKSWRILVGFVALGAASLGIVSSGTISATAATDDPSGSTAVVVCSSGTITHGDVQTSSIIATRVPAGAAHDTPGGCTVQSN
jgi:hypothetical protein